MKAVKAINSVRERIMVTVFDLFYRQGYRTTGINQIIAQSGVAKASFYDHFPSKDDLLLAYAQEQARREFSELRSTVESKTDPQERFYAALNTLIPWLEATHFRGCPFQNLMVEVPAENEAVRQVGQDHRENLRTLFRDVTRYLVANDDRYKNLNVENVINTYLLLFEGAIAAAVAYRSIWPVEQAVSTLKQFMET